MPATATIDGIYGTATRSAIMQWQQSQGTQITGFLSDADALKLEQQTASAQSTAPPTPPTTAPATSFATDIPLQEEGGILMVPVWINGAIKLNFVVDSGAADVSIPADVVLTLVRTGTIDDTDFIGSETYVLADGSQVPSTVFRIRSLKVGNLELRNITASIGDIKGTLLLGQSFLKRFRSWSIDNQRQVLVLHQ